MMFDDSILEIKRYDAQIVIQIVAKYRRGLWHFLMEMSSKWLLPGKELFIKNMEAIRSQDGELFVKWVISPESSQEEEAICESFLYWKEEVRRGVASFYQAQNILESKGLGLENEQIWVQELLLRKIQRFPHLFDYDIFTLMQKSLVALDERYRCMQSSKKLSHIISLCYFGFKKLGVGSKERGGQKEVFVKTRPLFFSSPVGVTFSMGCCIGVSFLEDNEILQKKNILASLQKCCSHIHLVEGSYFSHKEGDILLFYLEVYKEHGSFSFQEMKKMRDDLKKHIWESIESFMNPVFMPRNEEEELKYLVILQQQLTSYKDLPQIVILFNEQTEKSIIFTIIMVRSLTKKAIPVQKLFEREAMDVTLERVKHVGWIRKKTPKEASIVRIRIRKRHFLRKNLLDLYKARHSILTWLESKVGKVRDYNGGVISKQMEIFSIFQESLQAHGFFDECLLSNFFYALYPVDRKIALDVMYLKKFFLVFYSLVNCDKDYFVHQQEASFLCICMKNVSYNDLIQAMQNRMYVFLTEIVKLQVYLRGIVYSGFFFSSESEQEKSNFLEIIKKIYCELRYV